MPQQPVDQERELLAIERIQREYQAAVAPYALALVRLRLARTQPDMLWLVQETSSVPS
jgi:hypothetical protein